MRTCSACPVCMPCTMIAWNVGWLLPIPTADALSAMRRCCSLVQVLPRFLPVLAHGFHVAGYFFPSDQKECLLHRTSACCWDCSLVLGVVHSAPRSATEFLHVCMFFPVAWLKLFVFPPVRPLPNSLGTCPSTWTSSVTQVMALTLSRTWSRRPEQPLKGGASMSKWVRGCVYHTSVALVSGMI